MRWENQFSFPFLLEIENAVYQKICISLQT